MSGFAVEVINVTREFTRRKPRRGPSKVLDFVMPRYERFNALRNVSFNVKHGEIFGLLGPNGAGKTTLIKIIAGMIRPSSGVALVEGKNAMEDRGVRARIGLMLGYTMIYHRITGYDNLKFFASLYNVGKPEERIKKLVKMLGLEDWINSYVEWYSTGMKYKLAIARAMVNDPDVLILDEPTVGLDPCVARDIRSRIKELGKTIILCTHNMVEADELCDRICILNKGRIVAIDTPDKLKKLVAISPTLLVRISNKREEMVAELKKHDYVREISSSDNKVKIVLGERNHVRNVMEIIKNYDIESLEQYKPTLEDVFVKLTGERL
ncbi:MAG: ABC transporter ATP-binding protein [Candidatus Micrarchaeia archaeon]